MGQRHRITPVVVILSCWAASISAQDRFPVQRLTFDPAQEGFPSWSPDGATIVYSYLLRRDSGIVATPTGPGPIRVEGRMGSRCHNNAQR